jgi:ppGpp synthetase/RelA/SpoT-type nucleotidyltranferase
MESTQKILEEYRANVGLFRSFGTRLESLILELLRAAHLKVHSVTHRIKEEPNLTQKISSSNSGYASLADVTDICGVRIITYFAEEVDAVAQLVEREFTIDRTNSIDKRTALDPDQFGYLSVHYIVSLAANRSHLPEYAALSGLSAEIQIRSILQHAWAEIEHDLGYKSQTAVPRDVVRQFSRLAGLLEIADDGFTGLRRNIRAYEAIVDQKIDGESKDLRIDAVSIKALIDSDPTLNGTDSLIASIIGTDLGPSRSAAIEKLVQGAASLNFESIGELKEAIAGDAVRLRRLVQHYWEKITLGSALPSGTSLYYFLLLRALDEGGIQRASEIYGFKNTADDAFLSKLKTAYDHVKTSTS